jgi:pimeloyl-ACP methyl ester carboxylesterase
MKSVFILAGFDLHETATSAVFSQLRKGLTVKDYHVVPVDINWQRKNPSQYVKEFEAFYSKHKTRENIIIGNSFGAVVALLAAPKLNPDTIYLCSLSPYFKEDKAGRSDSTGIRYFGKRRLEDLWSYSADEEAEKLNETNIKVFVLYGEKEHQTSPLLVTRCKDVSSKVKGSTLLEIKNAPHDMSNKIYSAAIIDLLRP